MKSLFSFLLALIVCSGAPGVARAQPVSSEQFVGGGVPIANQGALSSPDILALLAPLRTERPQTLADLPPNVTDARFFRVTVFGGQNAIRIAR